MDKNSTQRSIIRSIICLLLTALLVWALAPYSIKVGSWSLITILAIVAYVVHWIAFVPAYIKQTEKFYDLTGSITYLSVISFEIKPNAPRFFTAWTLSGLWVFLTAIAAIIVITSQNTKPLGIFAYIGVTVWIVGFAIEVVADRQKRVFRKNPENKGGFISTGLWAWSRHPNYFGEIILWLGIFIIAIPVLQGWQWLAVLSPLFVYLLLTKVSGVPMLEDIADERWGGQEAYEAYKARTPVLMMKPPQKK